MGVADDLGYEHRRPNKAHAAVQAIASSRAGAWAFSKTVRHLDDAVTRMTHGKHTAPGLLAGLPVLDLTTTGRRSGQPRTSHLISIPIGADLALLGTNFGQPKTPAWVLNLEADPSAATRSISSASPGDRSGSSSSNLPRESGPRSRLDRTDGDVGNRRVRWQIEHMEDR